MRPVYGRSPWVDRVPKPRIPAYPKYRGTLDVDVAIVGGGLTGCATAYACAASGLSVALFEADRLAQGATASSSGWITDDPSAPFIALSAALGRRTARHAFQAWRRAALDFAALVRRLDLNCRLERRESLLAARTPEQADCLEREQKARRDAGLDTVLLAGKAAAGVVAFPVASAMRGRDSAVLDPYRAALGLAAAAVGRGARIFERSSITRTGFTEHHATLTLASGGVTARHVVIATGQPAPLFKPLARHFSTHTRYAALTEPIPARVRQLLGSREYLLRDSAAPAHRVSWVDDERLLVSGADGEPVPARLRDRALVQRTGQLMYELSTVYPDISGVPPAYGWDLPVTTSPHRLPVIGPHRNFPHHLFALGHAGHGVTGAYLASRILLRHCRDEAEPADEAFRFVL